MANNNYLMDEIDEDRVRKMYANRSILITGGTGFLGKVLIEKFLRFVAALRNGYEKRSLISLLPPSASPTGAAPK